MPWINLDHPTHLMLQWGWLLVTRANFVAYALLVLCFLAGMFVRLPGAKGDLERARIEAERADR